MLVDTNGPQEDFTLTMGEVRLIIEALDALRSNAAGFEPADERLITRCQRLAAKLKGGL